MTPVPRRRGPSKHCPVACQNRPYAALRYSEGGPIRRDIRKEEKTIIHKWL